MDIYEYYQEREEKQRRAILACEEAMQNIVQVLEKQFWNMQNVGRMN